MDKNQIIDLIDKYLAGLASDEEEQQLVRFFDSFKTEELKGEAQLVILKKELEQKMLNRLMYAIQQPAVLQSDNTQQLLAHGQPVKIHTLNFWKYVAASVAIIAMAGVLYFNSFKHADLKTAATMVAAEKSSLMPGRNEALLKLADGSVIVLNTAANGVLAMQGSTAVKKTKDGQLIYEVDRSSAGFKNTVNTITTPKGGQYQLTLPDGTKVWLNAASSLTFPTVFDAAERSVTLKGEAYFEVTKVYTSVAKGKIRMPFYVKTNTSEVEVLGTHFNVMAYPEADDQETTLLEGSVRVKHGRQTQVIIPGQQASIAKNAKADIEVKSVNTESVMAWKEGLFFFNDTNIEETMQQIGRWYNAEIVYQGPKPDIEFTGVLPRNSDLNKVLGLLQSAQGVKFEVTGNTIIVQKK